MFFEVNMRVKVAQLAQEGNAEFENIINNFRDEFTQMEPSNELNEIN